MPSAETTLSIAAEHAQHLQDVHGLDSAKRMLGAVCNTMLALPEHGVREQVLHMPCAWLGDDGQNDPLLPEDRQVARNRRLGWRQATYLIVVPGMAYEDADTGVGLNPRSYPNRILRQELIDAGVDLNDAVVTYACRFALPYSVKSYSARHQTDNAAYLRADIMAVKPKVVICIGAPSLKTLYGRNAKVDTYRGNVLDYTIGRHTCSVIPTVSHFQFLSKKANIGVFRQELRRAVEVAHDTFQQQLGPCDYRVCKTLAEVEQLCQDIRTAAPKFIAFDTEMGNDVARSEHGYTLSVQFAWAAGKAAFVQLRTQRLVPEVTKVVEYGKPNKAGVRKTKEVIEPAYLECGLPMHSPEDERRIWECMQQLLLDRRWKIAGHHLRVDVEQFARAGYPIDDRVEDGICTMLIHHALHGDERQGLDHLVRKYTPAFGAFWMDLEEWLDAHSRNVRLQFGYRDIPLSILIPYATRDADATWRVAARVLTELHGRPKLWKLYWKHLAPTSLHLLDVERKGILVDDQVRLTLAERYQPVYDETLAFFRTAANWPDFNPRSKYDVAEFLFSTCNFKDKGKNPPPEGARCLQLTPLYNTDKYPRDWARIVADGDDDISTPSTKARTIELLSQAHPEVRELKWLKTLSVIGKFLTTYLAPQTLNEFGVPQSGKGLHNNIRQDGRVTTRLSQLTQTGRYTSQETNLQTKPKKQESAAFECVVYHYFGCTVKEYKKRSDPAYAGPDLILPRDQIEVGKFAKCFIAPPGYCLIEADFKTAELFVWAYASGDPRLIALLDSGRDLHSEVAAQSFKLEPDRCLAAIAALEAGDRVTYDEWNDWFKHSFPAERTSAKTVNFGVIYGRSSNALAAEVRAQGVDIDSSGAQQIIDWLAVGFPVAWDWLQTNAKNAVQDEVLENMFGRCRYFTGARTMSSGDQAAVMREAKNSPIQGCVADLLAQAGVKHYRYRHRTEAGRASGLDILLPVHDAFLFQVPIAKLMEALPIIRQCMSEDNPLPGTNYRLNLDIEIFPHSWGDKGYSAKDVDKFMATYGAQAA